MKIKCVWHLFLFWAQKVKIPPQSAGRLRAGHVCIIVCQPGVWTKTHGTKITKLGTQNSKRGYDWNFSNYTWLLWSQDCSLFKLYKSAGTRGHPFKLHKKTVLTNQYAHIFTNRVINNWNSLPSNIVLTETLNSFKNLLDKCWNIIIYMA